MFFFPPPLALQEEMDSFKSQKMLILVSTVMTWAVTKPRELVRGKIWSLLTCCLNKAGLTECNVYIQEDPDAPLTEEEYRRRRPLPMFRNHHRLENLVLKLRKVVSTKVSA